MRTSAYKLLLFGVLALAAMLAAAPHCPADTISVTWKATGGSKMNIRGPDPIGVRRGIRGGPFFWEIDETKGTSELTEADLITHRDFVPGANAYVISFCIDLKESLTSQPIEYLVEDDLTMVPRPSLNGSNDPMNAYPMSQDKANAIEELWAKYFEFAMEKYFAPGATDPNNYLSTRVYADAFQVAIWEILFEAPSAKQSEWHAGTGDLSITQLVNPNAKTPSEQYPGNWLATDPNGLIPTANCMLKSLTLSGKHGDPGLLAWSSPVGTGTNGGRQDQLVQLVPEPGAVVSLAGLAAMFGLAGLGGLRRRVLSVFAGKRPESD